VTRCGGELFYRADDDQLHAVEILSGPTFTTGERSELCSLSPFRTDFGRAYDASADGGRFIVVSRGDPTAAPDEIVVVENFFEELQERVGR